MVFYFYIILFYGISVVVVISSIMFGTVVKMSTTRVFTLLIKDINDYDFKRSNKMPFLILHMIYHINIIIIRQVNTYINVYTII